MSENNPSNESILDEESLLKEDAGTEDTLLSDSEDSALLNESLVDDPAAAETELLGGGEEDLLNNNSPVDTASTAGFDDTLKQISSTLSSLQTKMNQEQSQLNKLSELSEIKTLLQSQASNPQAGHNLPNADDLISRIENLENKINELDNRSNSQNKKFSNVEQAIERFKALEEELGIEYEDDGMSDSANDTGMKLFDDNAKATTEQKEVADGKPKEKKKNNNVSILLLFLFTMILVLWFLDYKGIVNLYISQYFTLPF
jgi:uncharacterized coiled-coil protein SlyX